MRVLTLADAGPEDFDARRQIAEAAAARTLGEPMLLSWYDAARCIESPGGVSECQVAQPADGVIAYAASRHGALIVAFGEPVRSSTVFCFADLAAL